MTPVPALDLTTSVRGDFVPLAFMIFVGQSHPPPGTSKPPQINGTPPPRLPCPMNNFVLKNMVRTRVFVGHTVRCTRQYCETAVTHPQR